MFLARQQFRVEENISAWGRALLATGKKAASQSPTGVLEGNQQAQPRHWVSIQESRNKGQALEFHTPGSEHPFFNIG